MTIHYPWHPLHGQTLPAKRQPRSSAGEVFVHVLLPDETWCLLPLWMTSREACAGLTLSARGEVSAAALRELCGTLRELAHRGEPATIGSSDTAERKEERDDEEKGICRPPADAGSAETSAMGRPARGDAPEGSRAPRRVAARRRAKGTTGRTDSGGPRA